MNRDWPLWGAADAGLPGAFAGILAQVALEASRGETLDEVLKHIVDCIAERLPITIASIIVLNEQCTHFVQEVFAGPVDVAPPSKGLWPVSLGVSGRCARTGRPQLITDVAADPDYVAGHAAVQSEYLVPIRHRDRLLGVLNLESNRKAFFTPEVCAMFDAVAQQVAGTIYLARVVRELEQANRRLLQASMLDGLTAIANRRCFDETLAAAWKNHARRRGSISLVLVDIDYFKRLNDAKGHVYADECLRDLARACARSARRQTDLVARYGGEEFVVLLPDCGLEEGRRIAESLRAEVQAMGIPHPASPVAACMTVSAGVAARRPQAAEPPERLVEYADGALYEAKRRGRNRIHCAA